MKWKVLFTLLLLHIFYVAAVQGQTIRLSVAASMTDVFNGMMTGFSAKHSDAKFQPNFASSGSLAKQIEQGAPTDIFVSANPKWMKYLVEKELVAPGTDRILAFNQLVFVGAKKSTEITLAGLAGLNLIALGTPQSVPAGQYAKQAMEHAGMYSALAQAKKLVMAKDVRQALIYGATIILAGNIPGVPQTIPLSIYQYTSTPGGDSMALSLCLVSIVLSFVDR